ncbi:M48 family metallopeptidase [Sutcliffiella rhizosphaerae]|uniref:Protease HtpX n=1 Tax=Sutcliffiella rhizosphaerae TaxID=2880967 RepID=A0ABN8ACQ1_9BACI|nr:M48 family metallopeptidase [Sutcliffiella rhizosphaerae]CAG9622970.1 Protease HtpX [Sutcliffiella rhizosphaerae]
MKKIIAWTFIGYILYALAMTFYIWIASDTSIPSELAGTMADPATFLNEEELLLVDEYAKIRNTLYFLTLPTEWIFYFILLLLGGARAIQRWAERITKYKWIQAGIYLFWLTLFLTFVHFPFSYIRYQLSVKYNITVQPFSGWMRDQLVGFWEGILVMWIVVCVLYILIRKFQKWWWVISWLLFIPFIFLMMYIQPVVIDPLYNDFTELKDKELEEKILGLAAESDIPAEKVFEVNMSEKTNSINAYVTGVGGNARIVLWDTLLTKLNEDEILYIMAHEMGHYVMNHIVVGISGYILFSFFGFYFVMRVAKWSIRRFGERFHIQHLNQLASLPLLLLLVSLLLFVASPITNAVSRHQEHAADVYAIKLTKNPAPAIGAFQEITKSGLSEVNPPALIKFLRYTHPPMVDRISYLENYLEETDKHLD